MRQKGNTRQTFCKLSLIKLEITQFRFDLFLRGLCGEIWEEIEIDRFNVFFEFEVFGKFKIFLGQVLKTFENIKGEISVLFLIFRNEFFKNLKGTFLSKIRSISLLL